MSPISWFTKRSLFTAFYTDTNVGSSPRLVMLPSVWQRREAEVSVPVSKTCGFTKLDSYNCAVSLFGWRDVTSLPVWLMYTAPTMYGPYIPPCLKGDHHRGELPNKPKGWVSMYHNMV